MGTADADKSLKNFGQTRNEIVPTIWEKDCNLWGLGIVCVYWVAIVCVQLWPHRRNMPVPPFAEARKKVRFFFFLLRRSRQQKYPTNCEVRYSPSWSLPATPCAWADCCSSPAPNTLALRMFVADSSPAGILSGRCTMEDLCRFDAADALLPTAPHSSRRHGRDDIPALADDFHVSPWKRFPRLSAGRGPNRPGILFRGFLFSGWVFIWCRRGVFCGASIRDGRPRFFLDSFGVFMGLLFQERLLQHPGGAVLGGALWRPRRLNFDSVPAVFGSGGGFFVWGCGGCRLVASGALVEEVWRRRHLFSAGAFCRGILLSGTERMSQRPSGPGSHEGIFLILSPCWEWRWIPCGGNLVIEGRG